MRTKLKQARIGKNLEVESIANMANVKPDTWYKYESGARTPTMKRAKSIANILDCSLEDIFFDDKLDKKSIDFNNQQAAALPQTG